MQVYKKQLCPKWIGLLCLCVQTNKKGLQNQDTDELIVTSLTFYDRYKLYNMGKLL